ncbi:MAG: DUF4129 domain-containing protein [Pirellula sp.]|nr:DUF4129 domain-containing protein [Pirellula sp.]
MSAYWSVSGQFSFHWRVFARLLYCYFTNLIVVGILLPTICFAQSSIPDLPARDSLYQRWLPSQDNSSADARKLLEKLGLPSYPTEVRSPIPGLIPRDGHRFPNMLPDLTPAQREKLRKIAEQYVKDGNPPFKPEDLERIPPQLLDQFQKSPELQELAKELAEKSLANDQDSSEEAGLAQDPFAPAPTFSKSNDQQQNAAQQNAKQKDAPNLPRDLKSALPSQSTPPSQKNVDRSNSSDGNGPSKTNGSLLDPQRLIEGSPISGNSSRPPLSESLGKANGTSPIRPKQLNPGLSKPSQSAADNPPFPSADNSQFRPGAVRREANPSPSSPSPLHNRSTRNSTDRLNEKEGQKTPGSAPAETALEKMKRTFQELGFGSVMEKIAKEAAGLEQNETSNRNKTTSPTKAPSKADNTSTPSAPRPSVARSNDDERVASAPPRNQTAQRSEPSSSSTKRSSSEPRPSVAPPARNANSKEPSSPFELPKLEMPKFSAWWIVAVLSFIALGLVLWFLRKDPIVAAKVFGIKSPQPENATVALRTIRNRADVIDAFHQLIETKFRSFESWWTSRRALQHVNKALPSMSPPMREATEIYEMARYLPADQELSEPDLERMRRAMNSCSLTGVMP